MTDREIVNWLRGNAANTDTDPRWLAADLIESLKAIAKSCPKAPHVAAKALEPSPIETGADT